MGPIISEQFLPDMGPAAREAMKNIRLGLYRDALDNLAQASENSIPDAHLSTLKGRALEGLGLFSEAETAYWNALSIDYNKTFEPFLYLGLLKDRFGDREKGLWVLEEGLKQFPGNTDLLREAGILHGLTGEWDLALPYILTAYRQSPSQEDNLLALGPVIDRLDILELFGEMHLAFKSLLERHPDNPDIQDWHGRFLERLEKSTQALKFFRGLVRKNPRDIRLLSHVARLARNVNEPARAIDTYQLLMEETEESVELYLAMAETHKMNGKPLSALPLVRRALALDPNHLEAQIMVGLITIDQGDLEKAESAVVNLPYAPAHYQLGDLYLRKKMPVKAMGAYSRGFSIRPDPYYGVELLKLIDRENEPFLFLETLAWIRILFPKTTIPSSLLKKTMAILSENPGQHSLHNSEKLAIHGLANVLLPGRDIDLGYQLLEQAATVDPLSEVLYWVLAMVDEDSRRWMNAVEWYKKIKKNSREPVTLIHRIAENLHNQDAYCDLDPLLEEFIATYGPRSGFYRVLASVVSRTGDLEKSQAILKKGMRTLIDDSSIFEQYRSLEPEKWKRILLS
jgi:tetratricopeptide (TPR) repeat protein